jgi:HEPN domain-containing protein
MNIQTIRNFWVEEAVEALRVANHLFEKEDYSYALFFGHLAVEKLLKAIYVVNKREQAPYIHNLNRLAVLAGITTTENQSDNLIRITAYNLESRYPDEKRSFRKKCTVDFTRNELALIEEVFRWLQSMLQ